MKGWRWDNQEKGYVNTLTHNIGRYHLFSLSFLLSRSFPFTGTDLKHILIRELDIKAHRTNWLNLLQTLVVFSSLRFRWSFKFRPATHVLPLMASGSQPPSVSLKKKGHLYYFLVILKIISTYCRKIRKYRHQQLIYKSISFWYIYLQAFIMHKYKRMYVYKSIALVHYRHMSTHIRTHKIDHNCFITSICSLLFKRIIFNFTLYHF